MRGSHSISTPSLDKGLPSESTTDGRGLNPLRLLPSTSVIDGLIRYYFESCNWIYRFVNQTAFLHSWHRIKSGHSDDRIIMATVSVIMAVAVYYLPSGHSLLETLPESRNQLYLKFYDITQTILRSRPMESNTYTLDLVELHLIRCHFLTLRKTNAEEIWAVKEELLRIGTAMELHHDPGMLRRDHHQSERRRWAWWNIILLER
jgi:hypothetical protein